MSDACPAPDQLLNRLLAGRLEILLLKEIPHRDRLLREFDLDGVLARRPTLMLVDELAHSDDPGMVGGITGIRVWETVTDRVFDQADKVVLVDLPPDELLQRLKEGKVYLPDQAERVIQNFFRKGNLLALRELALRRTADRVDGEMRSYQRQDGGNPARFGEALLGRPLPGQPTGEWTRLNIVNAAEIKVVFDSLQTHSTTMVQFHHSTDSPAL